MTDAPRWLAAGLGAALVLVVLELVRRRLVAEEHSLAWLAAAAALLVPALWPDGAERLALRLGVAHGATLLLGLVALAALAAALLLTVVVSRQRRRIERLVEDVALLSAELRERGAPPAGERK